MGPLWHLVQELSWPVERQLLGERQELTGLANRAGGAFTGGAANSSKSPPPNLPEALMGGEEGGRLDGAAAGRLIGYIISTDHRISDN
jgi:hypothetical protein